MEDKKGMADTTVAYQTPKPQPMKGSIITILLAFGIVTLPMIVLSGLLLGLIFAFKLSHGIPASSEFKSLDLAEDSSAIYVDISATRLALIASFSSTIAPLIIGSAISLLMFPFVIEVSSIC